MINRIFHPLHLSTNRNLRNSQNFSVTFSLDLIFFVLSFFLFFDSTNFLIIFPRKFPSREMSHSDTIPLHQSSQSDIDEIENLINASVQTGPTTVLAARSPSPPRASIPVSSSPFLHSNLPSHPTKSSNQKPPSVFPAPPPLPVSSNGRSDASATGFGSQPNTLTEPVWDTVKRDLSRIVSNLKLVVFPNPFREDPGKALRDWDLWGPFFFIVFLGLVLSWSASVKKVSLVKILVGLNR